MKKPYLAILVVVVLLLAGAVTAWFFHTYEKVADDIRLPPKGEAAINPLYALRGALRAHGEKADTQRWFRQGEWKPGPRDTLVITGQAPPFNATDVAGLLAWVRGGGHLVVRSATLAESPALAQALRLTLEGEEFDCFPVREQAPPQGKAKAEKAPPTPADPFDADSNTASGPIRLCGASVRGVKAPGAVADGGPFARVAIGAGAVTLMPSLGFLHNAQLEAPAARELAYQVLAPGLGRGHLLLVYGDAMPSLWRLILRHGWPILVPLVLALLAWLAWRSQRFGTLRPVPVAPRRALLEHVQAAGEFAYRRGRFAVLHAALRARFERRLARRDPLLAALDGDARVIALAERCGLPASRVRHALHPTDLHRPDGFLQSISTLALMRLQI